MALHPRISVLGDKVNYNPREIPIEELSYSSRNPRIQWLLHLRKHANGIKQTDEQAYIFELLQKEQSVKNLKREINKDRGLQEPIIVRAEHLTVVEGNSRLAVYRMFNSEFPTDDLWRTIPCDLVEQLTEEQEHRILSQAHLRGRTSWSDGALAFFLSRCDSRDREALLAAAQLSPYHYKKHIKAINLMFENRDPEGQNFELYRDFVSSRIYDDIANNEEFHQMILDQIRDDRDFNSEQLRKARILAAHPDLVYQLTSGLMSFQDAYLHTKSIGLLATLEKVLRLMESVEKHNVRRLDTRRLHEAANIVDKIDERVSQLVQYIDELV